MDDQSHLDLKYFIGADIYNCPFCNRRNVKYENHGAIEFNWSNKKTCWAWRVQCTSCKKVSLHLTYKDLHLYPAVPDYANEFDFALNLDEAIFYSVPTSFFVIDQRIPNALRELISEAEGCHKMNYLTGALACVRKAIYELLSLQEASGEDYNEKISSLRSQNSNVDAEYFEILRHIKDMTSDHVHEQSWVAWDSDNLRFFVETLKAILHEIYVVPDKKKSRVSAVRKLRDELGKHKNQVGTKTGPSDEVTLPGIPGPDLK